MEHSPLGGLSAELRNIIYDFTFEKASLLEEEPGITQACKQTRAESLQMFYTRDFTVEVTDACTFALCKVLSNRDEDALKCITGLNVIAKGSFGRRCDWAAMVVSIFDSGLPTQRVTWATQIPDGLDLEKDPKDRSPGERILAAAYRAGQDAFEQEVQRLMIRGEGAYGAGDDEGDADAALLLHDVSDERLVHDPRLLGLGWSIVDGTV